jgi:hypothetical protein
MSALLSLVAQVGAPFIQKALSEKLGGPLATDVLRGIADRAGVSPAALDDAARDQPDLIRQAIAETEARAPEIIALQEERQQNLMQVWDPLGAATSALKSIGDFSYSLLRGVTRSAYSAPSQVEQHPMSPARLVGQYSWPISSIALCIPLSLLRAAAGGAELQRRTRTAYLTFAKPVRGKLGDKFGMPRAVAGFIAQGLKVGNDVDRVPHRCAGFDMA